MVLFAFFVVQGLTLIEQIVHWSMDNANNNHSNYLEHMEMGIHRDSDKGGDEVLVWSPGVRKAQLCFKVVIVSQI